MYTNMFLVRNGIFKANESMIKKRFSNDLRVFVHNYIPTPTSPEVKKLTGEDIIPNYFSSIKRKYKGLYLKHIVEVNKLAIKYIELALDKDYELNEEVISRMVADDYRGVYKIAKLELLEGIEAEIYLS